MLRIYVSVNVVCHRIKGNRVEKKKFLEKLKYWMCEYKIAFPKLKTRNPRAIIQIQEFTSREEKNKTPMVVLY